MKKRRALIISVLVLAILVCVGSGLLMRGYWREQAGRELILAIKANDTNRALAALRAHADPNVRDQGEKTPSLNDYLLKLWQQVRGIKPTAPNKGASALGLAVLQDNTVVVQALLTHGATDGDDRLPEVMGKEGWSHLPVLYIAVIHRNSVIVKELVRHGWDVNKVYEFHDTAMAWAWDADIIKTLLSCDANVNTPDGLGETPLDNAVVADTTDRMDVLLAGGAYDVDALPWAIADDNMKAVNRLLDRGRDIDKVDSLGETPLMTALGAGRGGPVHPAAALLLIRHSTNVNYQDKDEMTPLMFASKGESAADADVETTAIVKALIEKRAQINHRSAEGQTALMMAAARLHPAVLRLLLKHGAQVNIRTKNGVTALTLAHHTHISTEEFARRMQSETIRLLTKAGAKE